MMLALDDDRPDAELVWRGGSNNEIATDGLHSVLTTPVIRGEHIYGVGSFGQFRALNAATGERLWETQELTGERARWASAFIVAHEDRFFINNDRGDLIIARFSPAGYEEISRTQLIAPTSNSSNRRRLGGVSWVAGRVREPARSRPQRRGGAERLAGRGRLPRPAGLVGAGPGGADPPGRARGLRHGTAAAQQCSSPPAGAPRAATRRRSSTASSTCFPGRGVNTPVFVTDYGIVAIDPARSGSFEEVRTEVSRITVAPITGIVNTRALCGIDPERLAGYPELTQVVAQDNAAAALREHGRVHGRARPVRADPHVRGRAVALRRAAARSSSTTSGRGRPAATRWSWCRASTWRTSAIVFPAKGVPLIDTALGGSAAALPDTLDEAVAALERADVTFVLPGRAAPPFQQTILAWFTVDDVREYAAFCRYLLETVRERLRGGGSVDDIVANLELPERFSGYDLQHARPYVEAVRDELRQASAR